MDIDLWIIVGILFVLFFFGLFFLSSTGQLKQKKKRRPKTVTQKEQQEWKDVSLRLEKNLVSVRKENIELQKQVKILERELDIYQQKAAGMQEKLSRERGWQKKEGEDLDKKNQQILQIQEEIKRIEGKFEQEHAEMILLKRERDSLKNQTEQQESQIRRFEEAAEKARALSDSYRKEILELRAQNKVLSKRHDDVQWIAKSVHMQVKEELRQKTEELEAVKKKMGIV